MRRGVSATCAGEPPPPLLPSPLMCGLCPAPVFTATVWIRNAAVALRLQAAVVRVTTEEDGSRTLGEDTHAAYLTQTGRFSVKREIPRPVTMATRRLALAPSLSQHILLMMVHQVAHSTPVTQ